MIFYRNRDERHKAFYLYLENFRGRNEAHVIVINKNLKTFVGFTKKDIYKDSITYKVISINEYLEGLRDLNRTSVLFEVIFKKLWKHT